MFNIKKLTYLLPFFVLSLLLYIVVSESIPKPEPKEKEFIIDEIINQAIDEMILVELKKLNDNLAVSIAINNKVAGLVEDFGCTATPVAGSTE